jgi:pyruvate-formate lyase
MIIGGQDETGKDATNDLTYMLLDLWSAFELVVPVLSVRLSPGSPKKLFESCAAAIIANGSGEPALYNDETIIAGLVKSGIPVEEARGYSNDGCSEALIPGKSECSLFDIEALQLLEYVLNRGKSILRNEQEGIDTGDPAQFGSFEELYAALIRQITYSVQRSIENKVKHYGKVSEIAPVPLLSSLMDDCIQKGRDVTQGGARYIFHWPSVAGASHCVDSLAAIKKVVFEERKTSLADIVDSLKKNFEGNEALRRTLSNSVPKYGNDQPYVDEILTRLSTDIKGILNGFQEKYDWIKLNPNFSTGERYAVFGKRIGASADGRKAGEPIGSNLSPSIGMDKNGPTAALLSASRINHRDYMTGSPIDLALNVDEVEGEIGSDLIESLMRAFLELGPTILTLRVASPKTYRDAQLSPEKHKSLRVRVGGFSTYFITLSPYQQEVMINRLMHR